MPVTLHAVNATVLDILTTVMLVLFATEALARVACDVWLAIRRALAELKENNGSKVEGIPSKPKP